MMKISQVIFGTAVNLVFFSGLYTDSIATVNYESLQDDRNNGDYIRKKYKISHAFEVLENEAFGELKIDLKEQKVIQMLGNPESKDPPEFWGATGLYHQNWYYPEQGITVVMASETEQSSQTVDSISIKSPSSLKTQRGIGIGDSYNAVKQAYADQEDEAAPISSDYFVAGSVYGGLIFSFQDSQVIEMFLGAVAE